MTAIPRGSRRMLAPELLNEVVDGDHLSPAGEQEGQDRALLRSGDRQRIPAIRDDLEGSEHEETHLRRLASTTAGDQADSVAAAYR
jgi:hypothetical protein